MRTTSPPGLAAALDAAALRTHRVVAWVDVLYGGQIVAPNIPVTGGSVTYAAGAARARLDCTIAWPERLIADVSDYLSPAGYELQPWRGIQLSASETVAVSLGVFPIQRSSMNAIGRATQIQALDRAQFISDAKFENPYRIASGGNYVSALTAMITDGYPSASTNFASTSFLTPQLTFEAEQDRWEAAAKMAQSIGQRIFLNQFGEIETRIEPSLTDASVFEIAVARNLIDADRALDRQPAYNKVICRSRNASTSDEYEGEAVDPSYSTPFGRKPLFVRREYFNSDAQCETAAAAILASSRGIESSFDFTILPNPRIEVGDVITVMCPTLNVNEKHIIETLKIDLSPKGAITGTTRGQRITS